MDLKKIKIVHVNNISQLSGSQSISLDILNFLPNDKYEKFLICGRHTSGEKEFCERCAEYNIQCIILESQNRNIGLHDFKYLYELYHIFKREKFDIVHTNSSKPGLFGRIVANFFGVNLIIHTIHGISFHRDQSILKRVLYYSLEVIASFFCHKIILVNKYYRRYFDLLPWVSNITIYNGITKPNFNSVDKKKDFRAIFFGRLESQKDPLTFLKAIKYIRENEFNIYCNMKFEVFGEGNLKNVCIEYIERFKLSDAVQMRDWTNQKWEIMSNASVLVAPSIHEAFGLVFLEAGIMKLPIITTNVEGIPEVVLQNKTGFLVEKGDFKAIAEKLIYLYSDIEVREQMGLAGYNNVMKNFSLNDMLNSYKLVYES